MLTFNLKRIWFDKIKNGEKVHEYREVKPYWTKRLENYFDFQEEDWEIINNGKLEMQDFIPICLRCGYSTEYIEAYMLSISKINGLNTDLKVDKDVYDIEIVLISD